MAEASAERQIWLIDSRERWRHLYARALREAGYLVLADGTYSYPLQGEPLGAPPDLVVLACTAVTTAERRLVQKAALHDHRILILAASLPTTVMHDLFRAGAHDVSTMPVKPENLVSLVTEILQEVDRSHGRRQELLIASS